MKRLKDQQEYRLVLNRPTYADDTFIEDWVNATYHKQIRYERMRHKEIDGKLILVNEVDVEDNVFALIEDGIQRFPEVRIDHESILFIYLDDNNKVTLFSELKL